MPMLLGDKPALADRISAVRAVQRSLREGRFTSLGSYPKFYVTSDGGVLSHAAVKENMRQIRHAMLTGSRCGWAVVGIDINYEDADLYCDHTNERIPSAYAEPEEEVTE